MVFSILAPSDHNNNGILQNVHWSSDCFCTIATGRGATVMMCNRASDLWLTSHLSYSSIDRRRILGRFTTTTPRLVMMTSGPAGHHRVALRIMPTKNGMIPLCLALSLSSRKRIIFYLIIFYILLEGAFWPLETLLHSGTLTISHCLKCPANKGTILMGSSQS